VKIDFNKIYEIIKSKLNVSKSVYDAEMEKQYAVLKKDLKKLMSNKGIKDNNIGKSKSPKSTKPQRASLIESKSSISKTNGIFDDIGSFFGGLFDSIKQEVRDISSRLKADLAITQGNPDNSTASRVTQGVKNVNDVKQTRFNITRPTSFIETSAVKNSFEISVKSFIKPVDSSNCWVICPDIYGYVIDPICSGAAIAFCASMGPMGVTSNDESYGSIGNARLFSKIKVDLECTNGKVSSMKLVENLGNVGKEGPLQGQPPNGDYDRWVFKIDGGVAHIGYLFSGRPHGAAEPGFQAIRFRSCRWIWHYPYVKIDSCDNNGGWGGAYSLGASAFPTHKLWINGVYQKTVTQSSIENLWIADYYSDALVNGAWPYGMTY